MKPRIKWWGDGDVYASCFSVYRKCYPNAIATFRSEPIPFLNPKRKIVKIQPELYRFGGENLYVADRLI